MSKISRALDWRLNLSVLKRESIRHRWHIALVSLLTTITAGCRSAINIEGGHTSAVHQSVTIQEALIPNHPDLVTMLPFYEHTNDIDSTDVIVWAEIDRYRGIFLIDMGDMDLDLNRDFLRPSATGGVDTVLDASQDPHSSPTWRGQDSVHVMLRLGTLLDTVIDPTNHADARQINAYINHQWGDYGEAESFDHHPRLGAIGLNALEPFETIIDYPNHRVILIKLDHAGKRLVDVPSYTPTWSAPLIDMPFGHKGRKWWGVRSQLGSDSTLFFFDTGSSLNYLLQTTFHQSRSVWTKSQDNKMVQGTLVIGGHSFAAVPFHGAPNDLAANVLGFQFLRQFGVVGFNHRTHQWLLYQKSSL